ncbi:uncharacterized protein SOCE26_064830 [Sorangium cellulosum]|uniref:Uncharacterized protein n=1 Tax=Sorangium cellulosum TaxID=56 RepID=A0A2L0F0B5_SORCE|nr:kelch repeat-containing protein [Sorangium cellulosum]AUX45004.1 uncharacterized protein SOCE26_064830 [Sorangium cellulosum]
MPSPCSSSRLLSLLPPLRAAALLLAGCGAEPEDTSAAALRARFSDHAEAVLSARDAFIPTAGGFRLAATEQGGAWVRAARPEVELPREGSGPIRFRRANGGEIRVRELGAAGEGRMAERAVSYRREGGTSFWTATDGGVEEWLLLDAGVARGEAVVAAWHVEGATLRARGTAIELMDEQSGLPVLRVTAPRAYAASGRPVAATLTARGARIELAVDAGGEAALVDPAWEPAGVMNVVRGGHTATLLPGGKVLIAHGIGPASDNVELYDPTDDTWTLTTSVPVRQYRHTATLLQDGTVLLAGGHGGDIGSSALYLPATDSWRFTPNYMRVARWSHTATLLDDGQVLVVGGYHGEFRIATLASSELYDPPTESWIPLGSMVIPREEGHTATLLGDGRVLVTGGIVPMWEGPSVPSPEVEAYNPRNHEWMRKNPMPSARVRHTATRLLSGKVLVAGGNDGSKPLDSAELYDPVGGTWTSARSMNVARAGHTETLLPNGKVLVTGGDDPISGQSAELYDPAADTWALTDPMGAVHESHTATLLPDGQVLVVGPSVYVERYTTIGAPCTSDDDCALAACVEGVCCDSPCTEPCHTCARSTSRGRCVPQPQGSDLRKECAHEGCDGTCNGFGACSAVAAGDPCTPGECTDETHSLGPVLCEADGGTCPAPTSRGSEPVDCSPYRCDRGDGTCMTRCSSLQDCAPGFACDLSGRCMPPPPGVSSGCSVAKAGAAVGSGAVPGALVLALLAMRRRRSSAPRARPAEEPENS